MLGHLPYCGAPPIPGTLLERFNLDPVLVCALILIGAAHCISIKSPRQRGFAVTGWLVAAAAFLSPLCALSVSLFSARVAQHMVLVLIAAPLIALALPVSANRAAGASRLGLWGSAVGFFAALWFWHMPVPYDATFASSPIYWLMHVTLFGSAIVLWRELLQHRADQTAGILVAGLVTSMQMSLLGAVLTLASRPLFDWHFTTTWAWGLAPLQDQELGGALMWIPGIALFLWAAIRSFGRLKDALEDPKPV